MQLPSTSLGYPYDVEAFGEKHGISREAAEVILHTNGPSRQKCDSAARSFVDFRNLREATVKPPAPSIK
ncbi:hypothetical protein FJV76_24985 [Mesorhizobium sp. WSM4303]|nr:hypothetical protein FJV77_08205 [Mesorhizobium sp. WSM4306]TRC99045.1 hypothetical protein FJV76_24985 [Mesorhizobium sp. WSM4303]